MSDLTMNKAKQLSNDCAVAASALAEHGSFLTGQSVLRETAVFVVDQAAEITRLTEALAASEEARGAERAAMARECAAECWCKDDHDRLWALATDADNAALDKLLREARMEGMERAALAVTERADQEDEFAAMHGELENNSKAREAARVVTTLRGVAAHIRILAALEAPPPPTAIAEDA